MNRCTERAHEAADEHRAWTHEDAEHHGGIEQELRAIRRELDQVAELLDAAQVARHDEAGQALPLTCRIGRLIGHLRAERREVEAQADRLRQALGQTPPLSPAMMTVGGFLVRVRDVWRA